MQVQQVTVEAGKKFVETIRESVREFKEKAPGQPFNISFRLGGQTPPLTDSEALSYLDKLVRALAQFPEKDVVAFSLSVVLTNPAEEAWTAHVNHKLGLAAELEQNAADAKKIILPPGA